MYKVIANNNGKNVFNNTVEAKTKQDAIDKVSVDYTSIHVIKVEDVQEEIHWRG